MARALSRLLAFARLSLGSRRFRWLAELGFFLAALSTTLPLFAGDYVPIQDLPQHAAAVRVLADYAEPELGFARFFIRDLFATQYLSVYLLASALSVVTGAVLACKLVLALSLVSLPYALRLLLVALGKPRSFALLALPLAHNVHFVLGFMNYLAALPLLLAGLALAVRLARSDGIPRRIGLAVVALVCFYTHVVPFGVLVLGAVLVAFAASRAGALRRVLVPLAPALLAAMIWLFTNPAGEMVASLSVGASTGARAEFAAPDRALAELTDWLLDVLPGSADEVVLIAWTTLVLTLFVTGTRSCAPARSAASRRAIAWLVPLTFVAYFVAPTGYGFIWPIHARFPLIALLFSITALPRPSRSMRAAVGVVALGLSVLATHATFQAFRAAAREELAGLGALLARIPLGSRVAGLVWARSSEFVRFSPYLHTAAWAQAERGGAAMFSFADFAHSPFRFREEDRPPRVPPRWEWRPESVDARADLAWFDRVLTRGGPDRLPGWRRELRSGAYSLWVPE